MEGPFRKTLTFTNIGNLVSSMNELWEVTQVLSVYPLGQVIKKGIQYIETKNSFLLLNSSTYYSLFLYVFMNRVELVLLFVFQRLVYISLYLSFYGYCCIAVSPLGF